MNSEFTESKEVSQRSPFAGCAILIMAVLVMLFLVIFSVVVLFRQFDAISKFTQEKPVQIEIVALEDRESELNRLAEKIEIFRLAVIDGKSAFLELDPAEINLAIAVYEDFKDLRGTLRVREIADERIFFDISFRLNGKPRLAKPGEKGMMGSDPRYLNAILVAEPGLLNREVVLQVRNIEVENQVVPRDFMEQMSPYRIAERYVGSGEIGEVMGKLTDVSIGDGVIRFEKKSGELPKDTITNQDVDDASKRFFTFFGIAASIFLFLVAIILLLAARLKKRRDGTI